MTNAKQSNGSLKLAAAMVLAGAATAPPAMAITSFWSNPSGGSWGTAANWGGSGSVAGGVDAPAFFNVIDLHSPATVTLNGADGLVNRTVGSLTFADAVVPSGQTPKAYTISNSAGGILTLDTSVGHPQVTVQSGNKAYLDVVVAGNKGMTKLGTGTLVMSKTNTYTGPTLIQQGALVVTGSLSTASPVTVAAGAVLGGAGPVSDTLVQGTISPGQTGVAGREIGVLLTGVTQWAAGGSYDVGIAGAIDIEKGYSNDYVDMDSVSLPAAAPFNIDVTSVGDATSETFGFDGSTGVYEWVVARAEHSTFDLSRLHLDTQNFVADIPQSGAFALATSDGGHNLMLRYSYNAVPEATTLLFGSAAVMPLLLQRRRQSRRGTQA